MRARRQAEHSAVGRGVVADGVLGLETVDRVVVAVCECARSGRGLRGDRALVASGSLFRGRRAAGDAESAEMLGNQ